MPRCSRTKNLEIHHKRKDGGNDLGNAEVLCSQCHINTSSYGVPSKSPEPFSEQTKAAALKRAGNQCECTRSSGCH